MYYFVLLIYRNDLSQDELDGIKEDTVEQIKEFKETLDRMQKGNLTLESKVSQMRKKIREAISNAFNTSEMIKMFGEYDVAELLVQLSKLEEDSKLKRISVEEAEKSKVSTEKLISFSEIFVVLISFL